MRKGVCKNGHPLETKEKGHSKKCWICIGGKVKTLRLVIAEQGGECGRGHDLRKAGISNQGRCRICDKEYFARRQPEFAAERRLKRTTDPEWREKINASKLSKYHEKMTRAGAMCGKRLHYLDEVGVYWSGKTRRCRGCHRENQKRHSIPENQERLRQTRLRARIKNRYGITWQQYESLYRQQGGVCAICQGVPLSPGKRLGVDHDHSTGKVRGLLCGLCNTALGGFREDPSLLRAAIAYLSVYEESDTQRKEQQREQIVH